MKNNRKQADRRMMKSRNYNDAPITVSVKQSILELRRIYSDMTDYQFSKWYQKKYFVNQLDVLSVLTSNNTN